MLKIFIGFDKRESTAFYVLADSIMRRASIPVAFIPIARHTLKAFTRPRSDLESTDFSLSRFIVPYLCGYADEWVVFMDCDMLCRGDIAELQALADNRYSVMCVQHDYTPKSDIKFLGERQTRYEKKNWSSMMLMNPSGCRALTPDYVNTATGLELHQFKWLQDGAIGALPVEWNHLVGEYEPNPWAKLVHFTLGGPYFEDSQDCDYAEEWRRQYWIMNHVENLPKARASAK